MPLSQHDAAEAIRDVERMEAHSATLRHYERSAPHFLLWGVLWAIGYALCDALPRDAGTVWMVIVPIGLSASAFLARGGKHPWRFAGVATVVTVFFFAAFAVLAPVSGRQVAAFIPLVVAAVYAVMGLWRGPRFLVAGIGVAALTLGGFFLLAAHFLLWMAIVGGGAMILAGFWLRKV
jgi:hypothetical protein